MKINLQRETFHMKNKEATSQERTDLLKGLSPSNLMHDKMAADSE